MTLLQPSGIFQIGIEPSGSYQVKIKQKLKNITTSYHGVISQYRSSVKKDKNDSSTSESSLGSTAEIFSQFESIYNSQFYNVALKLIKPAFESSNLIYILNYWKTFGNAAIGNISTGLEVVGLENKLGVGLSGRVEKDNSVTCINLQRFNLIKLSYYKRLNTLFSSCWIDYGVEIQKNLKEKTKTFLGGIRLLTHTSEVKACINDKYNMGMSWEENISKSVRIGVSCEYNFIDYDYGVSFIYDN